MPRLQILELPPFGRGRFAYLLDRCAATETDVIHAVRKIAAQAGQVLLVTDQTVDLPADQLLADEVVVDIALSPTG